MKNKKIIMIGIILLIVLAIIVTVVLISNSKKDVNMKFANIINDNSNLPVKYMNKYTNMDTKLQKYNTLDNYMSKDYNDADIAFSYYGYPNDESEYYLGKISLITDKYNILGITIGDNMQESIAKLQKYGFELEERNSYLIAKLKYKDFTIELESEDYEKNEDEVKIGKIQLEVMSEYLGNRIY